VAPSYQRRRLGLLLTVGALAAGLAYAVGTDGPGADDRPVALRGDTSTTTTVTTAALDGSAIAPTDRFAIAPGDGPTVGSGPVRRYAVEVEDGIPVGVADFARFVEEVLGDPRGWTAAGDVSLQRVGTDATADFLVRLATPATTDAHCAPLDTDGKVSCRNGADVMINLVRWLEGAPPSGLELLDYRRYLISHEVGHALGHEHVGCPGPGQLAPVMLQQTLGLEGCAPNPWPHP
jgi:hypothetical protein